MEWAIHAIAVWVVFIFIGDRKGLKVNIWCGLFSVAIQMIIDTYFIYSGHYRINDPIISIWGSSIFFLLGPALFIGVLIAQYQPYKRWARVLTVFFLTALFAVEEYLLVIRKVVVYTNWNIGYSIVVDFVTMVALSWFSIVVLKRGVAKA